MALVFHIGPPLASSDFARTPRLLNHSRTEEGRQLQQFEPQDARDTSRNTDQDVRRMGAAEVEQLSQE